MQVKRPLKISSALCLAILSFLSNSSAQPLDSPGSETLSTLEKGITHEMNMARENPGKYVTFLEQSKRNYSGKRLQRPGNIILITQEGVSAVNEAIRFLRTAKPLSSLQSSRGMHLAARDHVQDQASTGVVGHRGGEGSSPADRLNRYGTWQKIMGENISYGEDEARNIVMGFIIDDGVQDRGHRKNIFKPDFHVVGVACGPHPIYRLMCVVTFAAEFHEQNGRGAAPPR
jgi:uncharacterized protein YkwD